MCRKDAAVAMDECEFRVGNLAANSLRAQLPDRLDDMEHAAGGAGMGVGKKPAMSIAWQVAVKIERAGEDCRTSLAVGEETDRIRARPRA